MCVESKRIKHGDGEKSTRTVETYRREIGRLQTWIEREGIHVLQLRRAEVNRFKEYLSGRYAANTVRLTMGACSSFYTYLEAERYIERTPFLHVKYPKRQYKKAVRVDQERTCPVMNAAEYQTIIEAIEERAKMAGDHVSDVNRRESAKQLKDKRYGGKTTTESATGRRVERCSRKS